MLPWEPLRPALQLVIKAPASLGSGANSLLRTFSSFCVMDPSTFSVPSASSFWWIARKKQTSLVKIWATSMDRKTVHQNNILKQFLQIILSFPPFKRNIYRQYSGIEKKNTDNSINVTHSLTLFKQHLTHSPNLFFFLFFTHSPNLKTQ